MNVKNVAKPTYLYLNEQPVEILQYEYLTI